MLQNLIDLFFPPICAGCNLPLREGETVLCLRCIHNIPLTNHFTEKNNEVFRRFYGRLPVEWASAMCYYHKKGIVQEMIHKLKYLGIEQIGSFMGDWAASEMRSSGNFTDITDVVPVPLHKKRQRERGYNQVTEFASAIAKGLSASFSPSVICRNHYSKTQTKKNLLARTSISSELFSVSDFASARPHFLLVDDVITTGSTLEACGKALLQVPDARISIACIAMAHW